MVLVNKSMLPAKDLKASFRRALELMANYMISIITTFKLRKKRPDAIKYLMIFISFTQNM